MSIMRKAILLGIGAYLVSKEKTQSLINEMVQKGEMSKDEANQFMKVFIEKGAEGKDEAQRLIRDEIRKIAKEMGFVPQTDLELLEKRVKELEEKLT